MVLFLALQRVGFVRQLSRPPSALGSVTYPSRVQIKWESRSDYKTFTNSWLPDFCFWWCHVPACHET